MLFLEIPSKHSDIIPRKAPIYWDFGLGFNFLGIPLEHPDTIPGNQCF